MPHVKHDVTVSILNVPHAAAMYLNSEWLQSDSSTALNQMEENAFSSYSSKIQFTKKAKTKPK